jgi:hypothetical protein
MFMKRWEFLVAAIAVLVAILAWVLPFQPVGRSPLSLDWLVKLAEGQDAETQWLYPQVLTTIDELRDKLTSIRHGYERVALLASESPQYAQDLSTIGDSLHGLVNDACDPTSPIPALLSKVNKLPALSQTHKRFEACLPTVVSTVPKRWRAALDWSGTTLVLNPPNYVSFQNKNAYQNEAAKAADGLLVADAVLARFKECVQFSFRR